MRKFSAEDAFSYLDKTEKALDGLQGWLDNTFDSIESYGQEGVDAICNWVSDWISYKIAQLEAMIVNGLHGAYEGALESIEIAGPIYDLVEGGVNADLKELVEAIVAIATPWVQPYLDAAETITEVPTKIVSIAEKISNLASYKPSIKTPGISLDNFHINFRMISMADVISGKFKVPEPPEPFTTYMKQSVASTKQKIAEERQKAGQPTSFKEAIGLKNQEQKKA